MSMKQFEAVGGGRFGEIHSVAWMVRPAVTIGYGMDGLRDFWNFKRSRRTKGWLGVQGLPAGCGVPTEAVDRGAAGSGGANGRGGVGGGLSLAHC